MAYIIPQNVLAYQENDIMQAVQYVDSYTDTSRRPVVIRLARREERMRMQSSIWTQMVSSAMRNLLEQGKTDLLMGISVLLFRNLVLNLLLMSS
ncbi:MAG: hypothetical protein J1E03_07595 [Acetatifactor sp.]|nr:hypothetical protein [Acetatifactor sp.]